MSRPDDVPASVHELLLQAEQLEIYALDPMHRNMSGAEDDAAPHFHEYRVLDSATLPTRAEAREVLGLIYDSVRRSNGMVAACFNPRHGIRATVGGDVVDFVICFECLSMHVHEGETQHGVLVSDALEPEVSAIWKSEWTCPTMTPVRLGSWMNHTGMCMATTTTCTRKSWTCSKCGVPSMGALTMIPVTPNRAAATTPIALESGIHSDPMLTYK